MKEKIKIICVIQGGVLQAVYADADSDKISVDLLDYDNMEEAKPGSEEYNHYEKLESRIANMDAIW